jgi:phage-related minor tail protein
MSDIGSLAIRLSLDDGNFNRSMSQVNRNLKTLGGEMAIIRNKGKEWGNSLEGLSEKQKVLKNILSQQEAKVKDAAEKHRKLAEEHGEGSVKAEKQAAALNKLVAQFTKTESELKDVNDALNVHYREMDEAKKGYIDLGKAADKLGTKLEETGSQMKDTGQNLTTGLSLPIAGFAVAAGKAALDFDKASGSIQAELGLSKRQAEELNATAKELWEDGFGESIESVSVKVAGVTRALGDLSKVDLSYVTKGLDLFEQRGWADQQEALRATKILMEQFGLTASESMDFLTKGFQENLDFSGEFLDSVSEYSNYFSEFGLTADDMFAKFKAGAEDGVFQLDKIGDAMKEFSLRSKDGSKTSTEAFNSLGLNAKKMTDQFNKGGDTAKKAFEKVIKALKSTEDETLRNEISVGLFGAQFEDVGEKAFDAMIDASKGLENVEGATKKASDAVRDNFGTRATKIWRDFQEDLEPIGETLLDIAEDVLPKVADTVGDVTEAFDDMSPAGKNVALAVGGIAIAAGPVLTGLGLLSTGLGTITKLAAPLLPILGKGSGFTGILSKIPGPLGLVTGSLAFAATAFIAVKDATEESKKMNLDHTDSLIDNQLALEESIGQYEGLRDKLTLSNDELGRYLDLQDKIKLVTDPGKIKEYKDEMASLQEKSGLTVKELDKFVSLDADIRENAPETSAKVTEYGNAFLDLNDDLQPVIDKQREFLHNQLQIEKDKAYENLKETADDYLETQENLNGIIEKHNEKLLLQAEYRQNAKELEDNINKARADGDIAAEEHYKREQSMWEEKANNMDSEIGRLKEGFGVEQERLNNLYSRIAKESKVYDQLIEQELKLQGINGKSSEALKLLDTKIGKLQEEKAALDRNYNSGQITTEEYQNQNNKLNDQITKLKDSRGRIVDIQGEQGEVTNEILKQIEEGGNLNTILDEDHVKDVEIDDNGGAEKLQREAEKGAHKNVKVDDNGDNREIQRDAEKSAKKGISFFKLNSVFDLLPAHISLPIKFAGNVWGKVKGMFADGTRNAPGGLSLVGEEGPELVHLPQGAKVIPNPDTEAILRNWNVPMLATGGVALTSGMAVVGEEGRELMDKRGAKTLPYTPNEVGFSNGGNFTQNITINSPTPLSPSQIARENLKTSRQFAMELPI